jgi:glucose-1-phosphate adenylyltransferase
MRDVMGVIDLNEDRTGLKELAKGRTIAAVPVGSKYRVIDFVLSNMVNSGITNIGLLKPVLCRSLMNHMRSKKEWGLEKKGLHMLSSLYDQNPHLMYKGNLEALSLNMDYMLKSKEKYVLISGSEIICNIDYSQVRKFHIKNKADITVVYKNQKDPIAPSDYHTIIKNPNSKITKIHTKDEKSTSDNVLMGMYFLERNLLIKLIKDENNYDFLKHGLIANLGKLKILGYKFDGYIAKVNTIERYYNFNLDLLREKALKEILFKNIRTKQKDEAPATYKEGAEVSNSLIANGCVIEGKVENSVLFRGVKVKKGAYIKNSILMQQSCIEEDVIIENSILDKEVMVQKGKNLIGPVDTKLVIPKKTIV